MLNTRLIKQTSVNYSKVSITNLKIQCLKNICSSKKKYMKFRNKPIRKGIDFHLGNPAITCLDFYTKKTHGHKEIHTYSR